MKFYQCDICGKIIAMVRDTAIETVCCGQPMRELVPGTSDGVAEKHVPVWTVTGNTVTVKVGATAHPMTEEHRIEWIAIETEHGNQRTELRPGDRPEVTFALMPGDRVKSAYAFCNLHGLWKS